MSKIGGEAIELEIFKEGGADYADKHDLDSVIMTCCDSHFGRCRFGNTEISRLWPVGVGLLPNQKLLMPPTKSI